MSNGFFQHQEEMVQNMSRNLIRIFSFVACMTVVNILQYQFPTRGRNQDEVPKTHYISFLFCLCTSWLKLVVEGMRAPLCMCVSEASFLCVHHPPAYCLKPSLKTVLYKYDFCCTILPCFLKYDYVFFHPSTLKYLHVGSILGTHTANAPCVMSEMQKLGTKWM